MTNQGKGAIILIDNIFWGFMKIEDYQKLIEDDMKNYRDYSYENCLNRDFLKLISFFQAFKSEKGLKTLENILNSYKVAELDATGQIQTIRLMKLPKNIRAKIREHASSDKVRRKLAQIKKETKNISDKTIETNEL